MLPFSRDPAAEALSRYREALLAGAPEEELAQLEAGLDPDLVASVRWSMTRARPARPRPDPQFVRDLRRELVQAANPEVIPPALAPRPTGALPGSADEQRTVPLPVERARPPAIPRPRWDWRQVAAAAALILLLGGSAIVVRYIAVDRPTTELAAPGAPTTETLVDAILTGAPEMWTPLTVERWQMQPGADVAFPALEGPQWIVADTGPVVATVEGQGQNLAPGQSLVVPAGQALELRNAGLAETALYRGVATTGFALPRYDQALVREETAFDTDAHEALPPGDSRLVFEQLTVPPGTTLKMETATGQNWFDIVTGQLGLTLIGDDLPPGWTSEQERELAADESIPTLVPGTRVWLRNLDQEPLVVLLLHVEAQATAATPAASAPPLTVVVA